MSFFNFLYYCAKLRVPQLNFPLKIPLRLIDWFFTTLYNYHFILLFLLLYIEIVRLQWCSKEQIQDEDCIIFSSTYSFLFFYRKVLIRKQTTFVETEGKNPRCLSKVVCFASTLSSFLSEMLISKQTTPEGNRRKEYLLFIVSRLFWINFFDLSCYE